MDRFIVVDTFFHDFYLKSLKSNMDRFIEVRTFACCGKLKTFKIQYG